jgi:excisionase family DNA binding protein
MASSSGIGTLQFPSAFAEILSTEGDLGTGGIAVLETPPIETAEELGRSRGSLLRVSEAAHELGVHENTIRNWVEKGILKAVRLPSGHRRLDPAEVDNLRLGILGNLAPATVGPRVELGDDLELDFQYGDPDS